MKALLILLPLALTLGGLGLAAFLWALGNGQFSDPDGDAGRLLLDDDAVPPTASPRKESL